MKLFFFPSAYKLNFHCIRLKHVGTLRMFWLKSSTKLLIFAFSFTFKVEQIYRAKKF